MTAGAAGMPVDTGGDNVLISSMEWLEPPDRPGITLTRGTTALMADGNRAGALYQRGRYQNVKDLSDL